jgi:AcrR family transcriptional regulator
MAAGRREQIVDASLELAAVAGWDNLRLYQVADRLGLPLAAIHAEFRDRDAVADAWFGRALDQVLAVPAGDLAGQAPPERLLRVMMRWFAALGSHRRVTGEMLGVKLYPGHPQHWVPLAFDLSRLIHWFLDAGLIASTGYRRPLAEIGLTTLFLKALRGWLRDRDGDLERLREQLGRDLERADRWLARLPRARPIMHQSATPPPPE